MIDCDVYMEKICQTYNGSNSRVPSVQYNKTIIKKYKRLSIIFYYIRIKMKLKEGKKTFVVYPRTKAGVANRVTLKSKSKSPVKKSKINKIPSDVMKYVMQGNLSTKDLNNLFIANKDMKKIFEPKMIELNKKRKEVEAKKKKLLDERNKEMKTNSKKSKILNIIKNKKEISMLFLLYSPYCLDLAGSPDEEIEKYKDIIKKLTKKGWIEKNNTDHEYTTNYKLKNLSK